ncbi:hypothetical protein PUN28_005189 [Cardiocondyla obscurior]|uniref:Uncharacterized protein n=1 Tax=Cardiocondyla obscurior TaxID=286306 RepID=A0AAW2GIL1_9HYME
MRFLLLILVVAPATLGTEVHNHNRERRQAQPSYRAFNQAPAAIKQILAAQQYRDPIVNLPPQQVPNLKPSQPIEPQVLQQNQATQYRPKVQIGQAPPQPTYKQIPVRPAQYAPSAGARQPTPQYNNNYAPQPQPQPQPAPQYRSNYAPQPQQPPAEPNYQYSRNLPPHLQQLVQAQYNLGNTIPQGQGRQG